MDQQTTQTPPSPQNFLKELEGFFHKYLFEKVPYKIPEDIKEFIVKYGPWINLVLLVLALPIVLAAFGLSLFALPFVVVMSPTHSLYGFIIWIITIVGFVIQIMALPGLFARAIKSWYLIYYATLINAFSALVSQNFFGFIIGTALSLYVLFQIKDKYH